MIMYDIVHSPVYKQPHDIVCKLIREQQLSQHEIDYLTSMMDPDYLHHLCDYLTLDTYQQCIILQRCPVKYLPRVVNVLQPTSHRARNIILLRTPPDKLGDVVRGIHTFETTDLLITRAKAPRDLVAIFRTSVCQTPLLRWFALTRCTEREIDRVMGACEETGFDEREAMFQRHDTTSIMALTQTDTILTPPEYRRLLRTVSPYMLDTVLESIPILTPDLVTLGFELGVKLRHIDWSWFVDNRTVIIRNIASFDEFVKLGIPWGDLTDTERCKLLHRCRDIFNISGRHYDLTAAERLILYRKCNPTCLVSLVFTQNPVTPLERQTVLINCPVNCRRNLISYLNALTPDEEALMARLDSDQPDRYTTLLRTGLTPNTVNKFGTLTLDERAVLFDCNAPHNLLTLIDLLNTQPIPPTAAERTMLFEICYPINIVRMVEIFAPLTPTEMDIAIDRCPRTELHNLCEFTSDPTHMYKICERMTPKGYTTTAYCTLAAPLRQLVFDCFPVMACLLTSLGKDLLHDEKIDLLRYTPPKQMAALLNNPNVDFTETEYMYGILTCHPRVVQQVTCNKWPQFRIWTLYLCEDKMCWLKSHQNVTSTEYDVILRTCPESEFGMFYTYCPIPRLADKIRTQRNIVVMK